MAALVVHGVLCRHMGSKALADNTKPQLRDRKPGEKGLAIPCFQEEKFEPAG